MKMRTAAGLAGLLIIALVCGVAIRGAAVEPPPSKLNSEDFAALKEALLSISNIRLKYEAKIAHESAAYEVKRDAILQRYKVSAEELDKGIKIDPEGTIERNPTLAGDAPVAAAAPSAPATTPASPPKTPVPPPKK